MQNQEWQADLRQSALIQQAEHTSGVMLAPGFASVGPELALVGIDYLAFGTELRDLGGRARGDRAVSSTQQALFEVESAETRAVVAEIDDYVETVGAIAELAKTRGHARAAGLDRIFGSDLETASATKSLDAVHDLVLRLRAVTLEGHGLPADMIARGQALADKLQAEAAEAGNAALLRSLAVARLHEILVRIDAMLKELDLARFAYQKLTGKKIPGLEQSFVAAATAPRPAAPVDADETGL